MLFSRIKSVYEKRESLDLDQESMRLLCDQYDGFVRGGALLDEAKKEQLRELDSKLSKLTLEFGENVLASTNAYYLPIENEEDLKGLTDGFVESLKENAQRLKIDSLYAVTLDYPSYIPFMQNSENRELREKLMRARASQCFGEDKHNNENLILDILSARAERAML